MGFNIGNVFGGAGSILGGIFGKKQSDKSAANMMAMAQQFQMDPAAKQWAQGVLANPGQREQELTGQLQGISGRAIDQQQEQSLKDFNAQHSARFSMGAGSGGAGPSATKFLNMTKALADARANAMSQGAMQGRATAFGEQSQAANFLRGNPEMAGQMMSQANQTKMNGQNGMIAGISGGLGQMFAPQQRAETPPWYEQYQKAAVMGQGQPTGPQQWEATGPGGRFQPPRLNAVGNNKLYGY